MNAYGRFLKAVVVPAHLICRVADELPNAAGRFLSEGDIVAVDDLPACEDKIVVKKVNFRDAPPCHAAKV